MHWDHLGHQVGQQVELRPDPEDPRVHGSQPCQGLSQAPHMPQCHLLGPWPGMDHG